MSKKTWIRPESVPYPTVWSKFNRTNKNGTSLQFEIQDITEDLFPACVQFMTKYYLAEEPMCTCLGFIEDKGSIQEQQEWWNKILLEKLSLVCLVKDTERSAATPRIAGINILYYHHKSHDAIDLQGEKLKTVMDIIRYVENQIDRYNLLKIEEYIDTFGLSVHSDFQGMGVATELLKARDALGKSVGLNASITMLTTIASQKAADKAGYRNLVEMKYSDLTELFPPYVLNIKDTPTIRYMCKLFSDI